MRYLRFIPLLLVLFSLTAKAEVFDNWTVDEKRMFWLSEALLIADWTQTRQIVKNPNYIEKNVILGERPSMAAVNTYFIGALIGNYFLADYLGENKMIYLSTVSVVQGVVVKQNREIGLRIGF